MRNMAHGPVNRAWFLTVGKTHVYKVTADVWNDIVKDNTTAPVLVLDGKRTEYNVNLSTNPEIPEGYELVKGRTYLKREIEIPDLDF